jgi:hypothetical protein
MLQDEVSHCRMRKEVQVLGVDLQIAKVNALLNSAAYYQRLKQGGFPSLSI